jgi:nitrite reductase/ring-hydroxylating ferredoxin subunit
MGLRVRVCEMAEVPEPGQMRGFAIDGVDVPVLVANIGGQICASSSMCPHEDVSLLDGDLDGSVLTCPGHSYEFDVITGDCGHDPDLCLVRYRVTIEGGALFVDLV